MLPVMTAYRSLFFLSLGLALGMLAAAPDAEAQAKQKPGKAGAVKVAPKLYRWVDEKGQAHFTDTLPEEALSQARIEYSRKGNELRTVDRPLTVEEQAAKAQQEAAMQAEAAQAAQAKKDLSVLRMSYPTEESIRKNFVQRRAIYEGRILALEAVLAEKTRELIEQLQIAGQAELLGKKLAPAMAKKIQDNAAQRQEQRQEIVTTREAIARLQADEDALVAQWRQAQAPARTTP